MTPIEATEKVADAMLRRSHVHGVAPSGDGTRIELFVDGDLSARDRAALKRFAAREASPFAVEIIPVSPARPHGIG